MNTQPENAEKLGLAKSLVYCCGQFGGNIFNVVFTGWIIYFYTTRHSGHGVLVDVAWIGYAQIAGRVVDAFTDLGVGYWSDVAQTRWGRRRPFILFGTPGLALTFFMLWIPLFPAGSPQLIASTFVVMGLFWFFFTLTMAPYLAMMPEICPSSQERVSMSTLMTLFMLVAFVYQGIAVPKIVEASSFKTMAVISGILGFVFMIIPGIFIKERRVAVEHEAQTRFIDAVKWTFTNKAFLVYITSSVFVYLGFAAITASLPFIVTRLLGKGIGFVAIVNAVMLVGFLISFVIVNILTKKMEKARLYRWSIIAISAILPLMFFLGRVDFGVPTWIIGLVVMVIMSLPIAANMVLPMAILADVIDYDEKITGKRREAIYFGCQGFLQKLATGLSGLMQTQLFKHFGYSMDNHLGVNLLGPVAGALAFIGFLIFLRYPLDEKTKDLKSKA